VHPHDSDGRPGPRWLTWALPAFAALSLALAFLAALPAATAPPPPSTVAVGPAWPHRRPVSPDPPPAVGLAGLVGAWRLDDGPASAVARDGSGLGNDCRLHDLDLDRAWVDGPHGGALELGGEGWLECPQPALPAGSPPPPMTIALWVRRHEADSKAPLVWRDLGGEPASIYLGLDGHRVVTAGRGWLGRTTARLPATPDRWLHLAVTHDAGGATRLYLDGAEVAHHQVRTRRLPGSQAPLMVGARAGSSDRRIRRRFDGAVADVVVYRRALTHDEVAALATGARPPP
jgi:hypothetical protein